MARAFRSCGYLVDLNRDRPITVLAVTKSMGDARGHVISGGSLSER
jgi:hypothetical protein